MSRKNIEDDEEDIFDENIDDIFDENIDDKEIVNENEDENVLIDLNIDIDEDCYDSQNQDLLIEDDDSEFDKMFKSTANKHKLEGTHTLKRDTIFMGKEDILLEDDEIETLSVHIDQPENYEIERGSDYEIESKHNEDYYYRKELVNDVYEILKQNTNIDFSMNRRKPNKQTFNEYYMMCVTNLDTKYSKSEIFVELSYYFTDNIFNMFKLLNKKNASGIILELKDKGYLTDIGNINFI